MLKKLLLLAIFTFTLTVYAQEKAQYGAEITVKETTKISDILSNPDAWLGKRVLIKGEVGKVCEAAGCWMMIKSDKPGEELKIKVKDGVIVFPVEASGKIAEVEGELYKIELDEEAAREYMAHLAEDAGETFDPKSVTGPMVIYQLKGIGALIEK